MITPSIDTLFVPTRLFYIVHLFSPQVPICRLTMFGKARGPVHNGCCGCWFIPSTDIQYLPQIELQSQTTILATTSRTVLNQTFHNPCNETLKEVSYTFPLYDGVSVAGFRCVVAGRSIIGVVKERNQARVEYQEAVDRGQTAGLLEQNLDAADVFTTSIGNVPAGEKIQIEITYLGELKNDAETDGARFTIPTKIAPRYGQSSVNLASGPHAVNNGGMRITVDVQLEQGVAIRGIQSPSHPIAVTMGRTSTIPEDDESFESNLGSSTLTLGSTELDKDFVVMILAKGQDTPRALLETHPTLPNQRTLMTTLVPKFNIPGEHPEIIFVVDRSGSMVGKMHLVIDALKVFLKSLPVGVKFNICSFGSHHTFLFERSRTYDATSLQIAMDHIAPHSFGANYGGTEMLQPVRDILKRRFQDLPLEVMLLTDGQIRDQQVLFDETNAASQKNARFFTLGIGSSASSSLVEGIAKAGRGFSQWVNDGERIDKRIVRMLKGALTPHIKYQLKVKYTRSASDDDDEDFEIVESFEKSMKLVDKGAGTVAPEDPKSKKKISLFDPKVKDEPTNPSAGRYDHLPKIALPNVLQTPHDLPDLYPHSRSTIYLMLGPEACAQTPISVLLSGKSEHGDLELEIPIQDIGMGETLHKLAAKKAMQELEEGRGWLTQAQASNKRTSKDGKLKSRYEGRWDLIVEREAVRLGTTFQVGGKFCSFVAIETGGEDLPAYKAETDAQSPERERPVNQALADYQSHLVMNQQHQRHGAMAFAPPAPRPAPFGGGFNPMAQAQARSAQPGGLFGNAQQAQLQLGMSARGSALQSTTSAFGSSNSLSGGGLFGSAKSRPPPPPAPPTSSLFGGDSFSSAGRLFGSVSSAPPPPPPAAAPTSSLFGNPQPAAVPNADPLAPSTSSTASDQGFNLDFSTLQNADILENFDFDSFLKQPPASQASTFPNVIPQACPKAVVHNVAVPHISPLEKMQRLISLQNFSGFWTLNGELLTLISHDAIRSSTFADTKRAAQRVVSIMQKMSKTGQVDENAYNDDVCATILAAAWLERVMRDEQDVWEMVVEKAKGWLEGRIDKDEEVWRAIVGVKGLWETR